MFLFWMTLVGSFCAISCEYAGTLCTTENIPNTYTAGGTSASVGGKSYLMQDEQYQFTCCGVVRQWNVQTKSAGTITMQIWRQQTVTTFELISQQEFTVGAGSQTITAEDHQKMSFREGDMIGWYSATADLVQYSSTNVQNNRYVTSQVGSALGDTFDWNTGNVVNGATFSIQAVTSATSNPYFINLPWYTQKADTEVTVSGISLLTLAANDPDFADNGSLTISMAPEWTDFFNLDGSNLVTTARQLTPGTYEPIFRVEEAHCGVGFSATLTVSVTDSMPKITNLPGSATIHEDTIDQTLLYTVSTTDPMNQAIFCEGTWTIGPHPNTPFVVKMITLAPGDSTAGIYLIEWPYLDYDNAAKTYELVVRCFDTYENTATGTFSVNIVQNQAPIFTNLGNMVEINATTAKIGDTVFTVSATDADGDQILYEYTCTPATTTDGNCPFGVYDTGDVKLKANLLTWDTNKFTLSITATANNDTITARTLIIYITNQNNLPVFTNVDTVPKTVAENSPGSTSVFQVEATDADSDTVTYFYDITPEDGYQIFECTTSGLIRTHSTNMIDYDTLNTTSVTSFLMTIYAHDTKEMSSATVTVSVTNVNEPVTFNQPSYGITMAEDSTIATTVSTYIAVTDPDDGDTATYVLNCGTYNAYFNLNTPTLTVNFAQTYDLDPGLLPDEVACAVYVTDSGGYNDTTTLFIKISYVNDNSPVFTSGTSYTVNLGTDTPVGYFIVSAVATDADRESDTIVNYSLDQSGLTGATVHIQSGHLYAKTDFSAVAVGTYNVKVIATDGTNAATATVTLVVSLVTTPDADTTNRYFNFFDDMRNIMWFLAACLTILGLLFLITVMLIFCYKNRKGPLFGGLKAKLKTCFDSEREPTKHQMDRRRRKKPIYGRQHTPTYKHLHARELLRASPEASNTPDIYDDARSTSANSPMSPIDKVKVSRVNLRENIYGQDVGQWIDDSAQASGTKTSNPSHIERKPSERDNLDSRRRRRRSSAITPLPASPSITLPQPSTARNVSNNPTFVDDDDDDFRSERLSIAASKMSNVDDL